MPAVHRDEDARVCGAITQVSGNGNVYANGKLISVNDDPNNHIDGNLIAGSNSVYINSKLVVLHTPDSAIADALCPIAPHCKPVTDGGSGDVFIEQGETTGVALGSLTSTSDSATVDNVLDALWNKVDIGDGDDYIDHLKNIKSDTNNLDNDPVDITVKMEPEITEVITVGVGNVSRLNLNKFGNTSLKKSVISSGSDVKVWQHYWPHHPPEHQNRVTVYRTGIVPDFKDLLKQALTDGKDNNYINLEELKQSIDSWTVPTNRYTNSQKVPLYIIDYEFKANSTTWVDELIARPAGQQVESVNQPDITKVLGFTRAREHIVVNMSDPTSSGLDKLMTLIHECSHFLHPNEWGAGDDVLLSDETMSKLKVLWGHRSPQTIHNPTELEKNYRLIPNTCTVQQGTNTIITEEFYDSKKMDCIMPISLTEGVAGGKGGTWAAGGNTFRAEARYRALPIPTKIQWPDTEFFAFENFLVNYSNQVPIFSNLRAMMAYRDLPTDDREDEFMARIYAIMATTKGLGFKKDIWPIINDYNRFVNGIPETITSREAELIDTEMKDYMKLDKRVY